MLQPSKIAPGLERHEEIFLARYARLRAWALQLAENDRGRAEDLVHDAYIQFTFTRPDLDSIGNLDGYLYTMLRNLNVSQVRRSLRLRDRTLSVVDYDSAELGLRASDPRAAMRTRDELWQVCRYACMRKETSKAGSVLILRFLHGYYPREIGLVMRSTREAVEERLRAARGEARQYLENPSALRFMREGAPPAVDADEGLYALTADEFMAGLRRAVFDSCKGDCPGRAGLERLYRSEDSAGVEQATLGHIVSCPGCLDEVNRILDLPLLSERFPTDTLGSDTRSKGGRGGGGGGGAAGGPHAGELRRCRRRARDVFEHRPSELCVSVNGYLMAAQKVGSELCEQTLTVSVGEKIDFVEVFSEQDVRLLFVTVGEPPAGAPYSQSSRVELSDERTLEATLSFGGPWPTLQVIYSDPLVKAEAAARAASGEASPAPHKLAPVVGARESAYQEPERGRPGLRLPGAAARLLRRLGGAGFWLRPGPITAAVALLLAAVLLINRVQTPAPAAAELLRRSAAAEEAAAADASTAERRTIEFEERGPGGEVVARRRIEVWQSAAHGLRLRRVYDDRGLLVAGEWTKADGTSTVYRPGAQPQARTPARAAARAILETGELWRLDASARDFLTLVGSADALTFEEGEEGYVLKYSGGQAAGASRLLSASLVLSKKELRAVRQTLVVAGQGGAREFRFAEAAFEQKPAGAVPPGVFQPEPELLGVARQGGGGAGKNPEDAGDSPADGAAAQPEPAGAVASPELEIEVTYLLNQIKANLGEQVSMTRTAGGVLRVEALAETEGRKEEILRALGPIIRNPAVRVEVSTVAEAVERQRREGRGQAPREVTAVREVEVANNRIPADAELRAYFSARLVGGDAVEQEINRFAARAMSRSRQALLRASALKSLVRRFSPEEVSALAPQARAKWLAMIREHALAYRREVASLRQELRPVFGGSGAAGSGAPTSDMAQAADRLLQLSYANDEAVRSAFTISADGRTAAAIKSAQFWHSLSAAEKLAEEIQGVYQK